MVLERLRRDVPQLYNAYTIDWTPLPSHVLPEAQGRLLSYDESEEGLTAMFRVSPGWLADISPAASLELLVIDGELRVDSSPLGVGGFMSVGPENSVTLSSPGGAQGVVFYTPGFDWNYHDASVSMSHSSDVPWKVMARPGDEPPMPSAAHGQLYKSLRVPDVADTPEHGGPSGLLRLLIVLPGYGDHRQSYHPTSWEEMLFLSGDIFMAERGEIGAGSYLANPARLWHDPLMSQRGAMMVVRTSAPQGAIYQDTFPSGRDLAVSYLRSRSLLHHPHTELWEGGEVEAAWRKMADAKADSRDWPHYPSYAPE